MESLIDHRVSPVISRNIPVYDETLRHSSSSDSTIRGGDYQRSNAQDNLPQTNSNRSNLIRERTPSPLPSPPSTPSSSSSSSGGEEDQDQSSIHRNGASNHHPPPSTADYEVLTDL